VNLGDFMAGWTDPKTQRATAFYAALGIVCSRIWHVGLDQWSVVVLMGLVAGGTISGLVDFRRKDTPADPPGGKE
jgi:hypothetical protein